MGIHTTSMPYRADAVAFFLKHAGWSWDPKHETEAQGRTRSARELAEAELWANGPGALVFEWEDDPDYDGDDGPAFGCLVRRRGERDVLASLWGITFGTEPMYGIPGRDPYCRVVEAELASEILRDVQENDLLMMVNPELRALVAYASMNEYSIAIDETYEDGFVWTWRGKWPATRPDVAVRKASAWNARAARHGIIDKHGPLVNYVISAIGSS